VPRPPTRERRTFGGEPQVLPQAERVLAGLCDLRLPLTLSPDDCRAIAAVIRGALAGLAG